MLRINKLTDYSLGICVVLHGHPNEYLSSSVIAQQIFLSLDTVRKILKLLGEAGLVESLQGATGGYQLKKKLTSISLLDLIEATDSRIILTECLDENQGCKYENLCPSRDRWGVVNNRINRLFASITLEDMIVETPKVNENDTFDPISLFIERNDFSKYIGRKNI